MALAEDCALCTAQATRTGAGQGGQCLTRYREGQELAVVHTLATAHLHVAAKQGLSPPRQNAGMTSPGSMGQQTGLMLIWGEGEGRA